MAKVISVGTIKGGIGKTTTTIELATVLKNKGKRVLVIDLDENCSLCKNIGANIETNKTSYEVLHGDVNVYDAIQHLKFFDIIVASKSLSMVEKQFIDRDDVYLLADLCDILKDDYDFIFIDNAPSRSLLLTMTYIAADYIICPAECDDSSTDMIIETERDVEALVNGRNHDSHAKVIGYILNRFQKTNMHYVALEKLEIMASKKKKPPFVAFISQAINASEIKTYHTAISETSKSSKLGRQFYQIAEEILRRVEEDK